MESNCSGEAICSDTPLSDVCVIGEENADDAILFCDEISLDNIRFVNVFTCDRKNKT